MEKNNKINFLLVILGIIFFILFFLSIYISLSKPLKTMELNVKFEVQNDLGLLINTSELNFGMVPLRSSTIRDVYLENSYDFPIVIRIFVSENLENVLFTEPERVIYPSQKATISFNLKIPENYTFGNYTGKVFFKAYKQ